MYFEFTRYGSWNNWRHGKSEISLLRTGLSLYILGLGEGIGSVAKAGSVRRFVALNDSGGLENGWIHGCMISVTGLQKRAMC